jgi:hypothetical protein
VEWPMVKNGNVMFANVFAFGSQPRCLNAAALCNAT